MTFRAFSPQRKEKVANGRMRGGLHPALRAILSRGAGEGDGAQ